MQKMWEKIFFLQEECENIMCCNMRRMWEIIFLKKLNRKHKVLYHFQKRRIQLMHMKVISENMKMCLNSCRYYFKVASHFKC